MKKLLFLLTLICGIKQVHAQQNPVIYTIRADSVKITNDCDTAELIIENHTQHVPGFLFNKGRGRTEFRRLMKLNDSTLDLGGDTLVIAGNTSAANGLSMTDRNVQLGQAIGASGNPAALLNNREIPTGDYSVNFLGAAGKSSIKIDSGGMSLGIVGSAPFSRLHTNTSGTLLVNNGTKDVLQLTNTGSLYTTGNAIYFNSDNSITPQTVSWYSNGMSGAASTRIFRTNPDDYTTFFGVGSGGATPSGISNTGIGFLALQSVTPQSNNNTAIGVAALQFTTTGWGNLAIGPGAGYTNTTGIGNIYINSGARGNTTQSLNTAVGTRAFVSEGMSSNTFGVTFSESVALGYNAGAGGLVFSTNGSATANRCIFIGLRNGPATTTANLTNTTIIGNDVTTLLSNVFLIGNSTQNIIVGNTSTNSGEKLQVTGSTKITDSLKLPNIISKSDTATYKPMAVDANGNVFAMAAWNSPQLTRTSVSDAGYSALVSDYLIAYTSLTAPRTVTLPSASGMAKHIIIVKDETGSAATHNITVNVTAGGTIDGLSSKVVTTNYGMIEVYSNGTQWFTK